MSEGGKKPSAAGATKQRLSASGGGESDAVKQADLFAQPDLGLAKQLFLLRENLAGGKDERADVERTVLQRIQENDMLPLYKSCAAEFGWKLDQVVLDLMEANIKAHLHGLEEKIEDAKLNLGETEIREGLLVKALYLTRIGDKKASLQALDVTLDKTVGQGEKLDVLFTKIRIGFFWEDNEIIVSNIDKAQILVNKGGDWDRKNRLKTYEGLHAMRIRNFSKAGNLFFDTLATFTSYELFEYNEFVRYCVLVATLTLDRPTLKARVVDSPEILSVILDIPHLSQFLNSFYECDYKLFFDSLANIIDEFKTDPFVSKHHAYYCREMRIKAYAQMLESYRSVQLESMAIAFGVSPDFIDKEISRFVSSGRLACKIDKVNGVIQTMRAESKSAQYQSVMQQGDLLMSRIHKLNRYLS